MTFDPYTPPADLGDSPGQDRSILSIAGLILTVILAGILCLIAGAFVYQSIKLNSFARDWQRMSIYIYLMPVLMLICAGMMLVSAKSFQQRRFRAAIAWFVGTTALFFGMPRVLVFLFA